MTEKGVSIRYGDIAPEAKENFYAAANDNAFNTLAQLREYNLTFPRYANPCELYQTVLDGGQVAFPPVPTSATIGLWSKQVSNDDGTFTTPIVLTLTSEGQYSSKGLTLFFDEYNGIHPKNINMHWWRGNEDLGARDFVADGAECVCKNEVERYNKIVITFYDLNMPKNRLKMSAIDYGYGTEFNGEQLRGVKLIQQIDPISSEISINTADFTLDSGEVNYSFQTKQPLSIYFNGKLRATTFVKQSKRKSRNLWQIQTEDYIGIMDSTVYYGGIYTRKNAKELMADIFTVAKVPFEIDESFDDATVTGYMGLSSCREALMQVAFAIQAVVDTSNADVVKVFPLDDEIKQTIPLSRIMQGQNFVDDDTVTAVEVYAHTYKPIGDFLTVYDAQESGAGNNIFVSFAEPLHDLEISSGSTILESGTNYAIINADENCTLIGFRYEHTKRIKTKKNPLVLASELDNIISIQNATLVSSNNVDNVLEKCYNWLVRVNQTNLKIVEGKHITSGNVIKYGSGLVFGTGVIYGSRTTKKVVVYDEPVNVGDMITAKTEYLGDVTGRVIKQTFNLNGGIIIKDTVLK